MRNCLRIFLILCYFSCKSQDALHEKKEPMYYIPTVTSEFEKMDFKKVKEGYLKAQKKIGELENPLANAFSYRFDESFDDKIVTHYYHETKKEGIKHGFEIIYYNNSPFMIVKDFYANGNIKEKGLYIIHGDYYKGTWYYYNEKGDLTNSIDYDTYFKFSWEDLLVFMKENDIQVYTGKPVGENILTHIRNNSYKMSPESFDSSYGKNPAGFLWTVTWRKPMRPQNEYTEVSLDGTTGKMGYRKKYTMAEEPGDKGTEEIEYFNLPKDKK